MSSLNLVLLVRNHVITKIVESHLVVRSVGYVSGVSCLTLVVVKSVNDKAYLETHELIELAHPLGVTSCKVIIDRNDVNAVARKSVEISGEGSNKSFTFTCFHFCDSSLMKNDTADNLNREVLHTENTPRSLTACGKSLGKDIVKRFAVCKSLLEFGSLCLKLFIRELCILLLKGENLIFYRDYPLDFLSGIVAEDFFKKTHIFIPFRN